MGAWRAPILFILQRENIAAKNGFFFIYHSVMTPAELCYQSEAKLWLPAQCEFVPGAGGVKTDLLHQLQWLVPGSAQNIYRQVGNWA